MGGSRSMGRVSGYIGESFCLGRVLVHGRLLVCVEGIWLWAGSCTVGRVLESVEMKDLC